MNETVQSAPKVKRKTYHDYRYKGQFTKKGKLTSYKNVGKRRESSDSQNLFSPKRTMRRIVDINYIAEQLVCNRCHKTLSLKNITHETLRGAASVLDIKCLYCNIMKRVLTTKQSSHMAYIFDVNLKIVMGALDAGIGATQLNALLSCVNIPCITMPLFKRYEDIVGEAMIKVARRSCFEAALLEKNLAILENLELARQSVTSPCASATAIQQEDLAIQPKSPSVDDTTATIIEKFISIQRSCATSPACSTNAFTPPEELVSKPQLVASKPSSTMDRDNEVTTVPNKNISKFFVSTVKHDGTVQLKPCDEEMVQNIHDRNMNSNSNKREEKENIPNIVLPKILKNFNTENCNNSYDESTDTKKLLEKKATETKLINVPNEQQPRQDVTENFLTVEANHITPQNTMNLSSAEIEEDYNLTLEEIGLVHNVFTIENDGKQEVIVEAEEKLVDAVIIAVSADMAWQRRGNGYQFDSLSGHSTLIGPLSGKVLEFAVMCSTCSLCKRKGGDCKSPKCRVNHLGSAKSMEAAAAVKMLKSDMLKQAGVRVGILITDEDSSTAAAVRRAFGELIKRVSDVTHALKSLKRLLYKVQPGHRELSVKNINYLLACAGTAIKKNKGNPDLVERDLKNVPFHAFGCHNNCGSWCKYNKDPENYRNKYLSPYMGDTKCALFGKVQQCFQKLVNLSQALAPCGSTQANESVNATVASKAPKRLHYSGTGSLLYRVAAAILQRNYGVQYPSEVFKTLLLSPGHSKHKLALHMKRLRESARSKLPTSKRKRKLNFASRNVATKRNEKNDTETYSSGMGFEEGQQELQCRPPKTTKKVNNDTFKPLYKAQRLMTLEKQPLDGCTKIYYDLETSGRSSDFYEILQIAAVTDEGKVFNCYIKPTKKTDRESMKVNQLSIHQGKMFHKGVEVPTLSLRTALQNFLTFLSSTHSPVLIGHKVDFDANFLLFNIHKHNMYEAYERLSIAFLDTCPLFREKYPLKTTSGLLNHKLTTLVEHFLGDKYQFDSHNALGDVSALRDLLNSRNFDVETLSKFTYTLQSYNERKKKIKIGRNLQLATENCGMKPRDLTKLVDNGWSLEKLRTLFCEGNLNNAILLLKKLVSAPSIIEQMYNKLAPPRTINQDDSTCTEENEVLAIPLPLDETEEQQLLLQQNKENTMSMPKPLTATVPKISSALKGSKRTIDSSRKGLKYKMNEENILHGTASVVTGTKTPMAYNVMESCCADGSGSLSSATNSTLTDNLVLAGEPHLRNEETVSGSRKTVLSDHNGGPVPKRQRREIKIPSRYL